MLDLTVDLHGKGVIVTAAGGSIGSACALALARCGASLALNDINPQALAETAARVQALGATVLQMPGDVSDYDAVQGMAGRAVEQLGNVFGLVNIAGASMPKPILEMTRDEWMQTLNINLTSLFNWAQAILPHMLAAQQGGRIINNSSVSGKQGGDENSVSRGAYAAAKAGVMGFTRGLAREVAPKVTVNTICPGLVLNPRTTVLYQSNPAMIQRYPMQRPGEGADIAKAVLYFMAADWVTGEITDVNGGYHID
jgi:3-oxoacyl-[acyl-carrier protein] reductase